MNPNKVIEKGLVSDLLLVLGLTLMLVLLRALGPLESPLESFESGDMPRHGLPPAEAQPPDGEQSAPALAEGAGPAPRWASSQERRRTGQSFISARDTINGERITDPVIIERIERIAAGLPSHLLTGHQPAAGVRYLAHGFGPGDDAPIFYGEFQEAAAALAFGCAMDEHLADRCAFTPVAAAAGYEDPPGVHCVPLSLAIGAPSYEPDRCEANG